MRKIFEIRKSVTAEEIEAYMREWKQKAPGFVEVFSLGKSGGYDISCAKITDPSIPENKKEIAVIMAQHTMEISGVTTVLSIGNFLARGSEEALEILKTQIVLLIPCPNMYSYAKQDPAYQFVNEAGSCEYAKAFSLSGVQEPDKFPAAKAIQDLIDTWKPEAIFDCHGVWYENQMVLETFGNISFANLNRIHDKHFSDGAQQAAEEQGFAVNSDYMLQLLMPTDPICSDPEYRRRFSQSIPAYVAQAYAYIHYHSLVGSFEISWERSGFAQIIRALQQGSRRCAHEVDSGYPVRVVIPSIGLNSIRTGGDDALQRRMSRIELWNNLQHYSTGLMHPEMPGLSAVILSSSASKVSRIFGNTGRTSMDDVMNALDQEGINTASMRSQLDNHWDKVQAVINYGDAYEGSIIQGFTLRIGIPYNDAIPHSVMLNGLEIPEDSHFGFTVLRYRNWTYVDVHYPAQKRIDFAIVMVRYSYTEHASGIINYEEQRI